MRVLCQLVELSTSKLLTHLQSEADDAEDSITADPALQETVADIDLEAEIDDGPGEDDAVLDYDKVSLKVCCCLSISPHGSRATPTMIRYNSKLSYTATGVIITREAVAINLELLYLKFCNPSTSLNGTKDLFL